MPEVRTLAAGISGVHIDLVAEKLRVPYALTWAADAPGLRLDRASFNVGWTEGGQGGGPSFDWMRREILGIVMGTRGRWVFDRAFQRYDYPRALRVELSNLSDKPVVLQEFTLWCTTRR